MNFHSMRTHIYLDYAATTPVDKRVEAVMQPYFSDFYGNPSSIHRFGQQAEAAIDSAREKVAGVVGCEVDEVIFTSCGSESDNLALRGAALAARRRDGADQILTSKTEHHAVSKTVQFLEEYSGFQVGWLEADQDGSIKPEVVDAAINKKTALVSVMYANNEIGTINRIREISEVCHAHGVLVHTDAVQAAAYLPIDVKTLGVDLMSLGGHKFHGPKGIGALYVRRGTPLIPMQTGGSQEYGLRAGTPNVPYIVGFAEALWLTSQEQDLRRKHVEPMRDRIIGSVLESIEGARLTGSADSRLPNHASFVFKDVDGNLLLTLLDTAGFACSSGSACKTGNPEPSEVMEAIGLPRQWALGSLRVTVGRETTPSEVDTFLMTLPGLVEKARGLTGIQPI